MVKISTKVFPMRRHTGPILLAAALLALTGSSTLAQDTPLRTLRGNTHPLARAEFDQGPAPADLAMSRMLLVLKPSASQSAALEQLLKDQQDMSSAQYHKWLTPQEFGQRFGASDADIQTVTDWLQSHGFAIGRVANGRNLIEFSGNAGQIAQAFHTEIHKFTVGGKAHWANASDPQIPAALASVVAGVSTLHNFRKAPQIARVDSKIATVASSSPGAQFTSSKGLHALAPEDFARIYGISELYGSGINGTGASVAVVSRSNVNLQDIADFRNAFGLSANSPQVFINGSDPGQLDGDETEAVLDTSWAGAIAPSATVDLVISASTNTTDGVDLSEEYIIDNNLADVMTESYGDCEANYTAAEGQFYSSLAAQAAAQGITYTVSAGDSGAEGCDDPNSVTVASGPISVNILAATPYDLAIGGTQLNESAVAGASYWNSSNDSNGGSVVGYIPEEAWNESCTVAQCGKNDAGIWAGSGGASTLFAKPSWQSGVAGIPNDGARDVPDISFTAASHDPYLLCLDGSCSAGNTKISFSGISGTSAPTPSFAGVMALIVQSMGSRQGAPNSRLYSLAGSESFGSCNGSNGTASSGCIFTDVTVGNNAVPGETGYGSSNAAYQTGVGYDLVTGLGSVNIANLVSFWSTAGGAPLNLPRIRTFFDWPSSNASVAGTATFRGWALADTGTVSSVSVAIDSVPYGNATYGLLRSDVCGVYQSANCPYVGWSFAVDTTQLVAGGHTLDATVTTSAGKTYTDSVPFTVANWTAESAPVNIYIDAPSSGGPVSGSTVFRGWALNDVAAITQVEISVDGARVGTAQTGAYRPDVCAAYPGRPGCPNVGWTFGFDTTQLADGVHGLAVSAGTSEGQRSATTSSFTVANNTSNQLSLFIDQPGAQSGALTGTAEFRGWAIGTSAPINNVALSIDGVSFGNATYGDVRDDVCAVYPGRPGCPNVGWNLPVDTTQLVNGLHALTVTAKTATGQYTKSTQTFYVANTQTSSRVLMFTDSPSAENSVVQGSTTFRGWAVSSSVTISGIGIYIDGGFYGQASYGAQRPDVCAIYPGDNNCPNVGWTFPIDTTELANGSHTISVIATHSAGQSAVSSAFTVANWTDANPMKLFVDNPSPQSGALSGVVTINGWAFDQLSAIGEIKIAVDGVSVGNASYGSTRADVCAVYAGEPGCPNVGWSFFLDTTLLGDGQHSLEVTGTTAGGQSSTFISGFQVSNSTGNPVTIFVDQPIANQQVTGELQLAGWAVDLSGAQIVSVGVLVDGTLSGLANYGVVRTDVCAAYPNAGGCPNVGWTYQLDTGALANGQHTIQLRALAADGRRYTLNRTVNVTNVPYL